MQPKIEVGQLVGQSPPSHRDICPWQATNWDAWSNCIKRSSDWAEHSHENTVLLCGFCPVENFWGFCSLTFLPHTIIKSSLQCRLEVHGAEVRIRQRTVEWMKFSAGVRILSGYRVCHWCVWVTFTTKAVEKHDKNPNKPGLRTKNTVAVRWRILQLKNELAKCRYHPGGFRSYLPNN